MLEFRINFQDVRADNVVMVHDVQKRKKPIAIGDNAKVQDEGGNVCYGFVERIDADTNLLWIALDRSTFKSAHYA